MSYGRPNWYYDHPPSCSCAACDEWRRKNVGEKAVLRLKQVLSIFGKRPNRSVQQGYKIEVPDYGRIVFPARIKKAMYEAQRGRCSYCGRTHRLHYLEIDHKHPVSRGGGNDMDNLQLLCIPCNMRKGIQTDKEFRYRYSTLLPLDGSIPSPPIGQEEFYDTTQRTRASREVRSIYHQRFSRYRGRLYDRTISDVSPLVIIGAVIVIVIILAVLAGD